MIIDLVKWDTRNTKLLAWKFPSQELSTWTQLIVNETQEAYLVSGGVYEGPYEGGRHTLSTQNIPILRNLLGIPFGGQSPFTAEVWYINKAAILDLKWGTPDPIQLKDPLYGVMVPVRAFGQYGIRIRDGKKFLLKLVGTLPSFDAESLNNYFKGIFIRKTKTLISETIIQKKISVLDISMYLDEISDSLRNLFAEELDQYGIEIVRFDVMSISVPEDDPSVISLKAALARRAELGILGNNYQQVRSFDVLEAAAKNEGTTGAFVGMGLGTGLGGAMNPMAQGSGAGAVINTNPPAAPEAASAAPKAETISFKEKIEMLKQLGELRAQGVLTEEEFATEKKRILG